MSSAANFIGRLHGARSQEWRTPDDLYAALHAEFGFTLDPCQPYRFDGLTCSWAGERVYCNPPYRRGQIDRWLARAREADLAVYLLPSRTGAAWWHEYVWRDNKPLAEEIRFVRGRLKFGGSKINAPEWSVILVYRRAGAREEEP